MDDDLLERLILKDYLKIPTFTTSAQKSQEWFEAFDEVYIDEVQPSY